MNITTDKVNRVEVIDEQGRSYVKYLAAHREVVLSFQDDDRTLKVFIQDKESKPVEVKALSEIQKAFLKKYQFIGKWSAEEVKKEKNK